MNTYFIIKKDDIIIAIDIMSEAPEDELEAFQKQGFKIVSDSYKAKNSKEAISNWNKKIEADKQLNKTATGENTEAIIKQGI